MAKFYGAVGYADTRESPPGVWKDAITERIHQGELTKSVRRLDNDQQANDGMKINNVISFIADPYASQHLFAIRYVRWMGANWKVESVDVQRPRVILTLGGVYNGPTA